jgi:hypothetical protein
VQNRARGIAAQLFPIPLTDYVALKKWECLDSDTGEASAFIRFRRDRLAETVRKYHLPDFSNRQHLAAFARAFTRLEKALPPASENDRQDLHDFQD